MKSLAFIKEIFEIAVITFAIGLLISGNTTEFALSIINR